jgi:membrane associated rhomboid family serine protease
MLSSGFTNAPVTRALVIGIVAGSILVSVTDVKHYFYILVDAHFWRYHQLWRVFTYQLCYTNSSEVLFACMTLYNLRVIERLWGSRKFLVSKCIAVSLELRAIVLTNSSPLSCCAMLSRPSSHLLSWLS